MTSKQAAEGSGEVAACSSYPHQAKIHKPISSKQSIKFAWSNGALEYWGSEW